MSDALRPDEVIDKRGGLAVQARKLAVDIGGLLPNLVKLLGRLLKDPRVPRRSKIVVLGAMAYVVSPIDLLPEFIPIAGVLDDILLVSFALDHLIRVAGEDVVLEHWDGPQDLLAMIRSVLNMATELVPARIRKVLGKLTGS